MGLKPVYRIIANSADVTLNIASRLVSLRLTDEAGFQSDSLELILADDQPEAPITMPEAGAELEVFLGYDVAATRMGLYVADEVEISGWPGEMSIRARAAQYQASTGGKTDLQTQKSRSWPTNTKLGDLVAKVAKEHGMSPAVAKSLASIVLPHIDQTEESDISFLVRLAKRYDAIAKPSGGKLVMAKRGESKTVSGEDLPTIALVPTDLTSWRMVKASREGTGTVIAYWHTKQTAKKIEVKVGSGEPTKRLRHWYKTAEAAKQGAQAELNKAKRGQETLSLSLPGNPNIAAECRLVLSGFRPEVNGEWLIKRAQHDVDSGGYRTSVEAERPNPE